MPTSPNTYAVATAIKAIMAGATVNGSPAYANTIIGGLKDYTDAMPVGVVMAVAGSVERYTLGRSAKIHDKPHFNIASVVPYASASSAEQQLYAIRDAVTFLFAQSATLSVAGPVIVNMVPGSERYSFPTINGNNCRAHEFLLEITYEYFLPNGPQP
ncbi:hypothetical protein [Tengunoibacter tsumagoiensis]|uniref:DUF3168 domain-containing protein n=1 Tax=Tengunoibacter tsumagoiensis TaxID=2014871 RepID=A0A402A527_9CHLR|nr:hypothetical protein [Tengunoibacter tsumagoiensis]GCE14200.1 hypothetical protein KTT_40590 [Tengunoibacter tsumagoiensis]GCE14254.1 hypothetical protein KTT_41130 [Tengunoibacter tsumagoiensis]